MTKEHIYRALTVWTGAQKGTTSDYESYSREYTVVIQGKLPFVGSADPAFRGNSHLYNPEELLVISLSACHMLSYLALCARAGICVFSYSDEACGKMTNREQKMRFTEVTLHPEVIIEAGSDLRQAQGFHQQAHQQCFIANSMAFPVLHKPIVRYLEAP
ncbi:MAG: OsmC family protein [Cyanophyceae cyanobacterium]